MAQLLITRSGGSSPSSGVHSKHHHRSALRPRSALFSFPPFAPLHYGMHFTAG
jgi:hypothetical protein